MLLFFIIIPSFYPISGQRSANYNATANNFIQQYYQQFDSPSSRSNLKTYYDTSDSTLSIDGEVIFGANSIFDKFNSLPKINSRSILYIDNQPKIDGGSVSVICGKLMLDNGTAGFFSEMIILTPRNSAFYVQNHNLRVLYGHGINGINGSASNGGMVFSNTNGSGTTTASSSTGLKFSG